MNGKRYGNIKNIAHLLDMKTVIEGVDTNIDFLFTIIRNSNFLRGKYDTSFIEKEILKILEELANNIFVI